MYLGENELLLQHAVLGAWKQGHSDLPASSVLGLKVHADLRMCV